jgi:hypothetical protein
MEPLESSLHPSFKDTQLAGRKGGRSTAPYTTAEGTCQVETAARRSVLETGAQQTEREVNTVVLLEEADSAHLE